MSCVNRSVESVLIVCRPWINYYYYHYRMTVNSTCGRQSYHRTSLTTKGNKPSYRNMIMKNFLLYTQHLYLYVSPGLPDYNDPTDL